jgi:hypothetical protein
MNDYLVTSVLDHAVLRFTDLAIPGLLLYQRNDRWHWNYLMRSSEDKNAQPKGFPTAIEALAHFINYLLAIVDLSRR